MLFTNLTLKASQIKKHLCVFLIFLVLSPCSFAVTTCAGTVQTLAFNPGSGILEASIGYGLWYLCSVSQTYNGVDPASCKMWYSTLLAAKISGKTILMDFDTPNNCNAIGNWSNPITVPYWVEIQG